MRSRRCLPDGTPSGVPAKRNQARDGMSRVDTAPDPSNLMPVFCGCSSVVEPQPSKLVTRVRLPSSARVDAGDGHQVSILRRPRCAPVAQGTEQEPSKLLVEGSNPSGGAVYRFCWYIGTLAIRQTGSPERQRRDPLHGGRSSARQSTWLWSRKSRVQIPSATPIAVAGAIENDGAGTAVSHINI